MLPVRENVNVPVFAPGSEAFESLAWTDTSGMVLSAIWIEAMLGVPTAYAPEASVNWTVSVVSACGSSTGVTVTVAVACPIGMVTLSAKST